MIEIIIIVGVGFFLALEFLSWVNRITKIDDIVVASVTIQ